MTDYHVQLTAGAELDLEELFNDTLERLGRSDARTLLDKLWKAIESLARNPLRRAIASQLQALGISEVRQMMARPYRLLFRVDGQKVTIFLIAHEKRDYQSLLERRVLR